MADLGTLKTLARGMLMEPTAVQWSDADLTRWINAAERDIAIKAGCLRAIRDLTTTPGTRLVAFVGIRVDYVEYLVGGTYSYSPGTENAWKDVTDTVFLDTADTLWADSDDVLWIDNPPIALQRMTPVQLGHVDLHGLVTPQYYFQWQNYLVIEPRPLAAYSLKAYCSAYPTDQMSDDADEPQIPVEFHQAIAPYVCAIAKLQIKRYGEYAFYYNGYITLLQSIMDDYEYHIPERRIEIFTPTVTVEKNQDSSLRSVLVKMAEGAKA